MLYIQRSHVIITKQSAILSLKIGFVLANRVDPDEIFQKLHLIWVFTVQKTYTGATCMERV